MPKYYDKVGKKNPIKKERNQLLSKLKAVPEQPQEAPASKPSPGGQLTRKAQMEPINISAKPPQESPQDLFESVKFKQQKEQAPQQPEKRGLMDYLMVGATPVLTGYLSGNVEGGFGAAAKGVSGLEASERQAGMKAMEQQAEIEKERLKQEGKGADRLKKSEVVLVEDPITGEPRYVTTQEATTMGYQPAAAPGTETFGQKKEMKIFEHQLDARMEKLKKELEESGPDFEKERKLRKDAENVLKAQDFFEIQGNVSNIKQIEETGLAAEGTPRRGAQDVSLLFSYLKILDPGSVVREGERGMVEASGTFGQRARTILERFNENKVLPDEVREGMIKEAKKTYQARVNNVIKPVLDRYGNIADRYGINKEAVTPVPLDWEEVGSGGSEEDKEIEELDKRIQQLQKELGVGE